MSKTLNNQQINQILKQSFQNEENTEKEKILYDYLPLLSLSHQTKNIDFTKNVISKINDNNIKIKYYNNVFYKKVIDKNTVIYQGIFRKNKR